MIFWGMFLTSIIDADYYSKEGNLLEYRMFILGLSVFYYITDFIAYRKNEWVINLLHYTI